MSDAQKPREWTLRGHWIDGALITQPSIYAAGPVPEEHHEVKVIEHSAYVEMRELCRELVAVIEAVTGRHDDAVANNPDASLLVKGCSSGNYHILSKALSKARQVLGDE